MTGVQTCALPISRSIPDQSPVEPDHLAIVLNRDALIGAVKACEVLRRRAHRRETEDVVRNANDVARVGRGDHQSRRNDRLGKDLADGARENGSGLKLSLRGWPHPLASREALTYRAASRIATCASAQ